MNSLIDNERRIIRHTVSLTKDEVHAVTSDIKRILEMLLLEDLTGSITIHTNRGGICEIEFTQKR